MALHLSKHYKTLELEVTASDVDVKKSYKRLALKFHPDKNVNDSTAAEKFKEIAEAYRLIIQRSTSVPPNKYQNFNPINAQNLFGQFFNNQQINRRTQTIATHRIAPQSRSSAQSPISTNVSYSSSSVQIINGKIIETIIERKNGATRKRTIIRDVS